MKPILLFCLLLILTHTALAQEPPTLLEVDNLRDELGAIDSPQNMESAVIAPDGLTIAWANADGICLFMISDGSAACHTFPPTFRSPQISLTWSPDSSSLVFTENVVPYFQESDLWRFNLSDGGYTNLTDDGILGDVFAEGAILDYLPFYDLAGSLYFFRTEKAGDTLTLALYHLPEAGDPEKLIDLTDTWDAFSVNRLRGIAFSADGSKLAMGVDNAQPDDLRNGIWILDLTSGEKQQVATAADLRLGLPAWADENIWVDTLTWVVEDRGLVVTISQVGLGNAIPAAAVYIDLTSGTTTPLMDFSDVSDSAGLTVRGSDGIVPSIRIPRSSVVLGDRFIYLAYFQEDTDFASIYSLPLPPDGNAPVELGQITDFEPRFPPFIASLSQDGVMMARGYRLVFE